MDIKFILRRIKCMGNLPIMGINDYYKNLDKITNDNRWDIWGIESKKKIY